MVKDAKSARPENGPEPKQGPSVEVGGGRVRFKVELNPKETTIVSWKKLLKKANLSEAKGPVCRLRARLLKPVATPL